MFNLGLKRLVAASVAGAALFAILSWLIPVGSLILILNGAFAGCLVALAVAFWKLVWDAALGKHPYNRVRQMTFGFFLAWVAYALTVYTSVYFRASSIEVTPALTTAAGRYVAIWAAILQATAPDFGLGLFHGRDRKTLWTGLSLGIAVAIGVVLAQYYRLLTF